MTIDIYTDGACSGNPGPGGWAAVIVREGATEEIGGYDAHTTNNRMELRAALEALRHVPADAKVSVHTDSQYLVNGMTSWVRGWQRRGWVTAEGRPVENRELWEELVAAAGRRASWAYVRGHAGHPQNERANAIAQSYALRRRAPAPGDEPPAPAGQRPAPRQGPPARPGVSYLSLVKGVLRRHRTWDECKARVDRAPGARYKKCASPAEEAATVASWGLPPSALETI